MSVASVEEVREDAPADAMPLRAAEGEAVRVASSLDFEEVRRCESGKSVKTAAPEGKSGGFFTVLSSDIALRTKLKTIKKQNKRRS